MSSYLHIFVNKDYTFTCIGTYSRSNRLYQYFEDYTPFEKITLISKETLKYVYTCAEEDLRTCGSQILESEHLYKEIGSWNNPIDAKLQARLNISNELSELRPYEEELRAAVYYISFLQEIDYPIYMGIECGTEVVKEDIK